MRAFLSLGSNISKRKLNLSNGIESLDNVNEITIIQESPIYETEPLYVESQNEFLNMVVEIETSLSHRQLLIVLKNIEKNSGRNLDTKRYGPRIIDIDILSFGEEEINEPDLIIPHPKIKERKFVLEPWSDIAKDYKLAGSNVSIYDLLKSTKDNSTVIKLIEEVASIE